MARINYRLFDQYCENLELLFKLFETIYGDSVSVRQRWPWEFLSHPEKDGVKIFVAEEQKKLCGMTVRMPCSLKVGGHIKRAFFATNSMVHPKYRGQGIMSSLYYIAGQSGDIQLSKGTSPAMFTVLRKIGYQEIFPNNFQTCLLSPFKWVITKMSGKIHFNTGETFSEVQIGDYFRLTRFDGEDNRGLDRLLIDGNYGGVLKHIDLLNWRYCDIPHCRYHIFVRKHNGEVISMFVLRLAGLTAYLVDICWSDRVKDEPAKTIKFAKNLAKNMGAIKLVFWGTLQSLRNEMTKQSFVERVETPEFNFFSKDPIFDRVNWADMHFVHGDSDVEYL